MTQLVTPSQGAIGRLRPVRDLRFWHWPAAQAWIFILPAAVTLLTLTLYPLGFAFVISFFDYDVMTNSAWFVGIENFQSLVDAGFFTSLRTTLTFAIPAVTIEIVLGVGLAAILQSRVLGRARMALRTVILLPLLMAPVVTGAMFKLMLNPTFGVLSLLFGSGDGSAADLLGNGTSALLVLIVIDVWMWTPFVLLLATAAMVAIPDDVYEAAAIDGAGGWRKFFDISLPLLRPTLVVVVLFRLIDCIKIADVPYAVTQGGPGSSTDMLSLLIYRTSFKLFSVGQGSAMSMLLIGLLMLPVLLLYHSTRRRGS